MARFSFLLLLIAGCDSSAGTSAREADECRASDVAIDRDGGDNGLTAPGASEFFNADERPDAGPLRSALWEHPHDLGQFDVESECEMDPRAYPDAVLQMGGEAASLGVVHGADRCFPKPANFVVLGDSVAVWVDTAAIESHLRQIVSGDLTFTNLSTSGTKSAGLLGQALQVEPMPGHTVVWLWTIGNDLLESAVMVKPEEVARILSPSIPRWQESWRQVFAYFSNKERFPDGVTFLLNTQYSISDQCPHPRGEGVGDSLVLEAALQCINKVLFLDLADQRPDTVAIDHYPAWLGHGNNGRVAGCPYSGSDNPLWISDGLHPNEAGSAHIVESWKHVLDQMYAQDCP